MQKNQPQTTTFLKNTSIKIRSYNYTTTFQLVLTISTYNIDNDELIQEVYRTLVELENFSRYIVAEYGGYIVPVLGGGLGKGDVGGVMERVEEYLEDLKNNQYCGRDAKLYCFLFQQPMRLPHVQTYTKVLSNASNMSKKYLNAIFTRKQLPEQKETINLAYNFQKICEIYEQFLIIKQIAQFYIYEQRSTQQILTIFAQLSGEPNCSPVSQEDIMLEAEKLIRAVEKYIRQTKQAYERWQILIERVRQLQNNLFKGLHEDEHRYQQKSKQLKNWTTSLGEEMVSMRECLIQFIDYICGVVNKMKGQTLWIVDSSLPALNKRQTFQQQRMNLMVKSQQMTKIVLQQQIIQAEEKYLPSSQTTLDDTTQKP